MFSSSNTGIEPWKGFHWEGGNCRQILGNSMRTPQYQPVGRSLSPLWGRGADDAWGLAISSFLDAFKDNSKFIFIHMFTSLNLYRRALLCPPLIQCINNAFKLSKTMSVFYFHQSPASSMVWSPLCPVCMTRTEHCNSLLSFPLSICLSCSQITFGFCSHTEDSQPLWSPPSLCTLQRNQDHKLGRDLTMESGFHGMQMDSLSTLATKAVQAWIFSLLLLLSLFPFFITVCYFAILYFLQNPPVTSPVFAKCFEINMNIIT